MTTCNMAKRIAEHRGVSERTGKVLSNRPVSAIREHAIKKRHPIDPENFSIIGSARSKGALAILESIQIKFLQPSLNVQTDAAKLLIV